MGWEMHTNVPPRVARLYNPFWTQSIEGDEQIVRGTEGHYEWRRVARVMRFWNTKSQREIGNGQKKTKFRNLQIGPPCLN
jgi:hypothetical protein